MDDAVPELSTPCPIAAPWDHWVPHYNLNPDQAPGVMAAEPKATTEVGSDEAEALLRYIATGKLDTAALAKPELFSDRGDV